MSKNEELAVKVRIDKTNRSYKHFLIILEGAEKDSRLFMNILMKRKKQKYNKLKISIYFERNAEKKHRDETRLEITESKFKKKEKKSWEAWEINCQKYCPMLTFCKKK